MSVNQLMLRNLRKNLRNYYLYVFALVFSVALYFAFVTLQYAPSMDEVKGSIKGGAAFRASSVLLVAIVAIFLLYANTIFIKRRSKEIGLFQLIGMTKHKIFRILTAENLILYFGSLVIGIGVGFSVSKLVMMMLFKTIGIEAVAELYFSTDALIQTFVVFAVIYLFIMIMNFRFIKGQSILSLFNVSTKTEGRVKKMSFFEIIIGVAGIALILTGYYISSKLFSGDFTSLNELSIAMIVILASVIIGTYLFYKSSVSFIFNLVRKQKNGYLNIKEVLSLSSIMFRMKSNAVLLTIITTVSALAIGLLSLSYISYYSAEKSAKTYIPSDFSITDAQDADKFEQALKDNHIDYTERRMKVMQATFNIEHILGGTFENAGFDANRMTIPVISEQDIEDVELAPSETLFISLAGYLKDMMKMKESGEVELLGLHHTTPLTYRQLDRPAPLPVLFTSGGLPVAIVDESVYAKLEQDLDPAIQKEASFYVGINLVNQGDVKKANVIFNDLGFGNISTYDSQYGMALGQKQTMGLIMFIVAFLGLAFLITSGCILYFKQMDESESEKSSYTILRKLGFTQGDLLRGIQMKQVFNFGIPLMVGLLHSYFAVKSGWFLFGTELWTPMVIVMLLYAGLYSVFGILSVYYYKRVIREAL